MPRTSRFVPGLCVLLLMLAGSSVLPAADYPDAAPAPPPVEASQANPQARYAAQDDRYRSAEAEPSAEPSANYPRPLRLPPVSQPAGGATRLVSDVEPQPQSLADRPRRLPLGPQSGGPRSGFPTADASPLATGLASLGIVIGLFLLVAWVVRRGMPRTASLLPVEAVEILGRASLVGRQQVHLVRCGSKILLVSVSPGSVETLTEITDPEEVERLASICQQANPTGVSASFRQVFQQFGKQPRGLDYLAGRDMDDLDFGHLDTIGHHGERESAI